jgi:hypothetical protein
MIYYKEWQYIFPGILEILTAIDIDDRSFVPDTNHAVG